MDKKGIESLGSEPVKLDGESDYGEEEIRTPKKKAKSKRTKKKKGGKKGGGKKKLNLSMSVPHLPPTVTLSGAQGKTIAARKKADSPPGVPYMDMKPEVS